MKMEKVNEFTYEEKQSALNEAVKVMNMKVFIMNDCDLVAAQSEEEAKSFYEQYIEREEIEEFFEGEADLNKKIRIFTSDLTDCEKEKIIQIIGDNVLNEDVKELYCTLSQWLEVMVALGHNEPFVIASTEY